jgi:hypothetical protein
LNGQLNASGADTKDYSSPITQIGGNGGSYWKGQISDVAVWNRALSASEVLALATSGVPPVSGLLSALDPNQDGYGLTWYDISGANRDATLPASGVSWLVPSGGKQALSSYTLDGKLRDTGTAAPVSGTYAVGDIIFNSTPAAAGTIGWVCTTAGTPGTWKTFGAISA